MTCARNDYWLTPTQLSSCLNVLLLIQASISTSKKEMRKVFADSGGNIVMHFPPEDDPAAHEVLKKQFPNLEMLVDDVERG